MRDRGPGAVNSDFVFKLSRAMLGIHVYRQVKKKRTTEDDFKSYVLGWCAEIVSFTLWLLITDDEDGVMLLCLNPPQEIIQPLLGNDDAEAVGICEERVSGFIWLISFSQMQACALIADDIMDGSETRRGKPCWHTLKEVGLNAVNGIINTGKKF